MCQLNKKVLPLKRKLFLLPDDNTENDHLISIIKEEPIDVKYHDISIQGVHDSSHSTRKKIMSNKLTIKQKYLLLECIEANELLKRGKVSFPQTTKDLRKEWEDTTVKLNACPGPNKTWKEWRRTWQDIKAKAKVKAARINAEQKCRNDGGPPKEEQLTEFQKRVLNIIGPAVVYGMEKCQESTVFVPGNASEIIVDENEFTQDTTNFSFVHSPPHTANTDLPSPHIANSQTISPINLSYADSEVNNSNDPLSQSIISQEPHSPLNIIILPLSQSEGIPGRSLLSPNGAPQTEDTLGESLLHSSMAPQTEDISRKNLAHSSNPSQSEVQSSGTSQLEHKPRRNMSLQNSNLGKGKNLKEKIFQTQEMSERILDVEERKLKLAEEKLIFEKEKFQFLKGYKEKKLEALQSIASALPGNTRTNNVAIK